MNTEWSKNAKNRSTHNTYFTLPVIFIMLSNHFPATYGNKYNWLVLLVLSGAGAAIRHAFIIRKGNINRTVLSALVGFGLIIFAILLTKDVV